MRKPKDTYKMVEQAIEMKIVRHRSRSLSASPSSCSRTSAASGWPISISMRNASTSARPQRRPLTTLL